MNRHQRNIAVQTIWLQAVVIVAAGAVLAWAFERLAELLR